jgi:diguanylate cyclase (GGDEF)-like protein
LWLLRPADTVCRYGGDEFTVLCENTDEEAAAQIAQRILDAFSELQLIDDHEVHADASVGFVVSRDPLATAETLLRDSDHAMYRAKQRGGAQVAMFEGQVSGAGPTLHAGQA